MNIIDEYFKNLSADEKLKEINYANIRNKNMSEKKIKNMRKIIKKKDC